MVTVTLNNLTIKNCKGTNGAAIYCYGSSGNKVNLIINGCVFENNTSSADGGAIRYNGPNLTIINSKFTNNSVNDGTGNAGAILSIYGITVINSRFENNSADYRGGAISSGGKTIINNSAFIKNSIYSTSSHSMGGAIYHPSNSEPITIIDSNFTENSITSTQKTAYGGAIYSSGVLNIINSKFNNNSATTTASSNEVYAYGGAIYIDYTASLLNITNSKFNNNTAISAYSKNAYGGAIYAKQNTNCIINSSNFTSNNAYNGAAIYKYKAILNITHSNFENHKINFNEFIKVESATSNLENNKIYTNKPINVTDTNGYTTSSTLTKTIRVETRTTGNVTVLVNEEEIEITPKTTTQGSNINFELTFDNTNLNEGTNNVLIRYTNKVGTQKTEISEIGFSITLTKPEYVNINVTKVWLDNNNQDGKRPTNITVNLTMNGKFNQSVILNETNNWKHTFTDLPKYENGNLIIYNFTENIIPYYDSTVTNNSYNYTITNRHILEAIIYAQVINDIEGKVAIEIKVFDRKDDEVPNSRLNITLDDNDATITTINTNRIYLNPNLTAGKHNITIKYSGNDEYGETTLIKNFTVVSDPNKLIDNLTLNITNLEKNVTDLQNQIDNITKNNLTQLKSQITNLQNQIDNITKNNITKLEQNITNLTEQIIALNITINILNQTIQDQNITKLNQTVQDLIQEVDGMSGDIADLKNQIKDIVILQNQINELKNQVNELETLPAKIIDLQNQINSILNNNLTSMEEKINELETLNDNITALQNQIKELETLNDNITDLQNQINNITGKDIIQLKEKIKNLNGRIIILNNTITTLNTTIQNQNITGNITNLQNQINELKNNTHHCDIRDLIITQNKFLETIIQLLQNNQNTNNNPTSNVSPSKKTTKKKTKITSKKKTFKHKVKTKKYKATLKSGKKRVAKVYLYITIKGKKYKKTFKAKTNKKGTATFKIKKLTKKGKYKATIKYKGNKKYKASKKTVKIIVK